MREVFARSAAAGAGALLVAAGLAACGANTSNEDQAAQPTGHFPAAVQASFPLRQHLAQPTNLIIKVKNTGTRAMPNVAVTLENPADGSGAQALGTLIAAPAPGQPILAGRSRAVWVIDQAPGACDYSCHQGGPGAGATAYTNTWALGPLAPGATATFDWHVTAVQSGGYAVAYKVAAGLSGRASATGPSTSGTFKVDITSRPREAYVNDAGQVVYTNPGN